MMIVCGLLLAGCSEQTRSNLDRAREAANQAAEATEEGREKAASAIRDVARQTQEGLAKETARAAETLKGVEGGSELLKKVTDVFQSAGSTLQGITDAESAKAALPKLKELTNSTDEFAKAMARLPENAKPAVAGVMEGGIANLKVLVEKVLAIPGVESVLKPAVTELVSKLAAVAGKKE
jgi:hypothetical protein